MFLPPYGNRTHSASAPRLLCPTWVSCQSVTTGVVGGLPFSCSFVVLTTLFVYDPLGLRPANADVTSFPFSVHTIVLSCSSAIESPLNDWKKSLVPWQHITPYSINQYIYIYIYSYRYFEHMHISDMINNKARRNFFQSVITTNEWLVNLATWCLNHWLNGHKHRSKCTYFDIIHLGAAIYQTSRKKIRATTTQVVSKSYSII